MTLISVRWREAIEPPTIDIGATVRTAAVLVAMPAIWIGSQFVWKHAGGPLPFPQALGALLYGGGLSLLVVASLFAPFGAFVGLRVARVVDRGVWTPAWALGAPWMLHSVAWILPREALLAVWLVPLPWAWFGIWPLSGARPAALHRAHWATRADLRRLLAKPARAGLPPAEGVVLGRRAKQWLVVRSRPQHRELGGALIVGRPRSGKGLLAVTQILGAWQERSLVCTDLKGELHAAIAGWRSQSGKVIVLDPTGVGHRFDPLADRDTEDDLYRAAQDILHVDGEVDGQAFTERAASMLAAIFVAAKREAVPCLPYARELIRANKQARVRSKGGATEWVFWQTGTALLLPRLLAGRAARFF